MTKSKSYFDGVQRGDWPDHSAQLNKMHWYHTSITLPNSEIKIRIDPSMDETVVRDVFTSVGDFILSQANVKYSTVKLDIMYHKMRKSLGGTATATVDSTTNTLDAIILISKNDVLLLDDTLTHEMVHFWDYATDYSVGKPSGTHQCYVFDIDEFNRKNTKDKVLMAVDSAVDDILEYINDPRELLVSRYFNLICDDNVEGLERSHGLSERVINTIDRVYKEGGINKKEAKRLMRYYINMVGTNNPKFKYLNQFVRRTKAGRF